MDYDLRLDLLNSNHFTPAWLNEIGALGLLKVSKILFNDYRIVPLIFSMALLVLVYFLSYKITGNRIASLLSVLIVASSKIFFWYSTSMVYPNFWVLFLLLAVYPLTRKSKYSHLSFLTSIFSKGLSFVFLPILLYYPVKLRQKGMIFGYVLVSSLIVGMILALNFVGSKVYFHVDNIDKITNWATNLKADPIILALLIPVVWCLIYLHKKRTAYSGFLLVSLLYSMFVPYILVLFTDYVDQQYRFLPFVVFFALSCSLIISKGKILVAPFKRF